ncbi:MAG: hypothetical protein LUG52_09970 [Clostridia bacterium]|nr:hypothetical protein [Clostridia bacterium]
MGRNNSGTVSNCYNIGSVSGGTNNGGVAGVNESGCSVINCYYLEGLANAAIGIDNGTSTSVAVKTSTQFASGEVAYLLNGSISGGTTWYQNLDNGETVDSYPVLDSTHGTAYYIAPCGSSPASYSNSLFDSHVGYDADGFCTNCGGYKPAERNSSGIYEISNAGQLFWFAALVNGDTEQVSITAADTGASAVLTDDIDLDGKEWTPIGTKDAPYAGTFDGGEFTVSGLSITTASAYMGLFGYVSAGTVKNLAVSGEIDVSGSSLYAGGIVGTVKNGVLSNLTSDVSVTAYDGKKGTFGGVAATVEDGSTMELCENLGTVTASGVLDCVGGIVGYMNSATIENCANYGAVDTSGGTAAASAGIYTGGIIAYINNASAVVTGSLNTGKISGVSGSSIVSYTGAIVGRINQYVKEVSSCYYLSTSAGAGVGGNGSSVTAETEAKDADALASGEVTYLLTGGVTDGTQAWHQTLNADSYPTLDSSHGTVYYTALCDGSAVTYSNSAAGGHAGYDEDGFCTGCGGYEPAELNSNGEYEIGNAGQLFWFAALVNGDTTQASITAAAPDADAVLTDDIDLESKEWTPIGNYGGSSELYYSGTFDGKGYSVSGLYINSTSNRQGLFGYVNGGTVQNVAIGGSVTATGNRAGIAVGHNAGTVKNITVSAAMTVGGYAGGAVGYNTGTVQNVSVSGTVTSDNNRIGGVVGFNDGGSVEGCYSSATVSSSYMNVGGVVGYNNGAVTNCYNSGNVSGRYVGGVVGWNNSGSVSNCYSTGSISGESNAGGVVGLNNDTSGGTVTNCYYLEGTADLTIGDDPDTSADDAVKTAAEFASGEAAYLLNSGTADGTQAWYQTLGEDSYPILDGSHGTVYRSSVMCDDSSATYSNSAGDTATIHVGYDADGFCTGCGGYEPAEQNGEGAYEIGNAGQLYWFAALVKGDATQEGITAADTGADAVLTANIDLDGREWVPIGTKSAPYAGTFDGGSYAISGLSITEAADYMGLFGYVSAGEIKNLTISGEIDVSGSSLYAGGIVGTVKNGVLLNLTSNVNVTAYDGKKGTFGGVAATAEGDDAAACSTVENCTYNGTVKASGVLDCVGGIVGYMNAAAIVNCANYGTVDTSGGTAAASAGIYTGGIVSYINNENAVVKSCLNIGKVSGVSDSSIVTYTGAIVGRIRAQLGEITNTYYLDTSADAAYGADESGAELGMTAKTEAALASGEAAYLLQNVESDSVWGQDLENDAYPMLFAANVVKLTFVGGASDIVCYANVGVVFTDYPTGAYAFYTDSALTEKIDTSVYTFTEDATLYMAQIYAVTQNLTNVVSDNTAAEATAGGEYVVNLTAADGYVIESVSVTMGGADITAAAYSDGAVKITGVSGDIVITATAAEKELKINGVTVNGNCVDVDITNTLGKSGVVIAAAYDADGVMIGMASAELPTGSGSVSVEIDAAKAAEVKAFVWESVETMAPLCEGYVECGV